LHLLIRTIQYILYYSLPILFLRMLILHLSHSSKTGHDSDLAMLFIVDSQNDNGYQQYLLLINHPFGINSVVFEIIHKFN